MLNVRQILVSAAGLMLVGVGLAACGQRGALYLPTEAAAKNRATLPGLLLPGSSATDSAATPSKAAVPAQATDPANVNVNGTDAPAKTGDAK